MVRRTSPPESERPLVTCWGVASMANQGMTPVAGCQQRRCCDCDEAVWISPATDEIQRREDALIVCMACASVRLVKAGASTTIMSPTRSQLDEIYAASGGWAAILDPKQLPSGSVFEWQDHQWEVADYFEFPCCGTPVALIRRVEEGARSWSGLGCPMCQTGETFTVEQTPASDEGLDFLP